MFETKYESGTVTLTPTQSSLVRVVNRLTNWDQIHYDNIIKEKPRLVVPVIVDLKPDSYISGINIATRITDFDDKGIKNLARDMVEYSHIGLPNMLSQERVDELTLSLYNDLIDCRETLNQIENNSNQNY